MHDWPVHLLNSKWHNSDKIYIYKSCIECKAVKLKIYLGKSENELLFLYALVFPYIFLLFDCLKLALIDRIVKCKVLSVLSQLALGG